MTLGMIGNILGNMISDAFLFMYERTAWWWSGWDPELDPLLLELRRCRKARMLLEMKRLDIVFEKDGSKSVCL